MPEIYIREKDKQDAKIREVEKRCKALDDECRVLRQRLAVVEDRFREPEKSMSPDEQIRVDAAIKQMAEDAVKKLEEDAKNETPLYFRTHRN